jgi:hypothetical protein
MIRVVYVVALYLGAVLISHGCVAQDTSAVETSAVDSEILIGGGGGQCGNKVCSGKTFCCNASCGICAPLGGGCTQQVCLTAEDSEAAAADDLVSRSEVDSEVVIGPSQCGNTTCAPGTRCCNPSCGTCVRPGDRCTDQICNPTE